MEVKIRRVLYLLGQLSDQDAEWLATAGVRMRLKPGETLIARGVMLDRLFVVLDGELSVGAADGKEIARVACGDILGEMSFVDRSPTSATVAAVTDAVVLAVDRSKIEARFDADAAFAARFYKAIAVFLADRMRNVMGQFGYGKPVIDGSVMQEDELDESVLDSVHVAGSRFDRIVRRLMG